MFASDQSTHNQLYWTRQIPQLVKKIAYVIEEVKKPLNYILPFDFSEKIQKCRSSVQKWTKQKLQEFSDVLAFFIEVLAQQFAKQFGGKSFFWIEVISDFGVCQKYDENLKIWHVNDCLKHSLYLPAQEYEKMRKFQKMAKNYILIIKSFIKAIEQNQKQTKTKINKDQNQKQQKLGQQNEKAQKVQKIQKAQKLKRNLQQTQSKYLDQDKKFTQFIKNQYKQLNLSNPNQSNKTSKLNLFSEKSNQSRPISAVPSFQNNSNSKSRIKNPNSFNFQHQKFITDFIEDSTVRDNNKHNKQKQDFLNKIKMCNAFPPIQKNVLAPQNLTKLSQTLLNISQNRQNINQLRQEYFKKSRIKIQKPKKPHFVSMQLNQSFFRLQNFFINDDELYKLANQNQKINYTQPLKQYEFVVYDADSQAEFDQLLAQDLENQLSDDFSSVSSFSDVDFINNEELQQFKPEVVPCQLFDKQRFVFRLDQHQIMIMRKEYVQKANSNSHIKQDKSNNKSKSKSRSKMNNLNNNKHQHISSDDCNYQYQYQYQQQYQQQQQQPQQNSSSYQILVQTINSSQFQNKFSMICLQEQLPIKPSDQTQKLQFYQKMSKIIHGCSWKEITNNLLQYNNSLQSQQQPKYTSKDVNDFVRLYGVKRLQNFGKNNKINIFYVKDKLKNNNNNNGLSNSQQLLNMNMNININMNIKKDNQQQLQQGLKQFREFNKTDTYYTSRVSQSKKGYEKEDYQEDTKIQDLSQASHDHSHNHNHSHKNNFNMKNTKRFSQNSSTSRHSNFSGISRQNSKGHKHIEQQDEQFPYKKSSKSNININNSNNNSNNINTDPDSQYTRRSRRIQQLQKIDYSKFQIDPISQSQSTSQHQQKPQQARQLQI